MAIEYAKVLMALEVPLVVIGRGDQSAENFTIQTNLSVALGGVDNWLNLNSNYPQYAIVAVTGNQLGEVARSLLRNGIKNILLEKPGGLDDNDIKSVADNAEKNKANVLIAYNRRFYASVIKAKKIIDQDGGAKSFTFEFTEWANVIKKLKKGKDIKSRWLLHNSTHVIDLAFFLGGEPKEIKSYSAGGFEWHPMGSIFTGAGIAINNALFSYHSNWDAPGRWGVEVLTQEHRLIFKPLEKLQIQKRGSVTIEEIDIDAELDLKFKPGLYRQVDSFLNNNFSAFMDIHDQVNRLKFYSKIISRR